LEAVEERLCLGEGVDSGVTGLIAGADEGAEEATGTGLWAEGGAALGRGRREKG